MASDRGKTLGLSLEELRRHYDAITTGFDSLRSKALGVLVGELAVVTFLFSAQAPANQFSINTVATAIFLGIGVFLLAMGFILSLWVSSPTSWTHPPETKIVNNNGKWFQDDPDKLTEYLHDEYIEAIKWCGAKASKRADMLTWAIYGMAIGILILAVLKFGGSALHF
jgi:hypothetical protein